MGAGSATNSDLPPGWQPLAHCDAVAATPELKLIAICDTDEAKAKAVSGKFGLNGYFTDYRDMLAVASPDIVTIATRTEGRCQIIADCANAGVKGVFAEKPLARSMAEVEIARKAIEANGTRFAWGATRRYMGIYQEAKCIIDSGELGSLRTIIIKFGRGGLQWTHPHSVDIASYFAGDAQIKHVHGAVTSDDWTAGGFADDPVLVFGHLQFANGVTAHITDAEGCDVVLCCSDGEIQIWCDGLNAIVRRRYDSYLLDSPLGFVSDGISGTQRALLSLVSDQSGFSFDLAAELQQALLAMAVSGSEHSEACAPYQVPDDFTILGRSGEHYA
jgi:predicted dehydrogenase